ncbi:MAG: hypothetical protein IT434_00490, partial [Phycisphaerales bacterium]|nr:hypothetical protein [Phycisphaerales bacterium]
MSQRSEHALGHRLGAVYGVEPEDGHLEVGREEEQIEELRNPSPRESQPARHRSAVSDVAPVDGPLQVVREGEHLGHLGGPVDGRGLRWRRRHREHHAALP